MKPERFSDLPIDEAIALIRATVRDELAAAAVEHEPADEWLDLRAAAKLLGLHPDTVRKLTALPVHHAGRRLRYNRAEVEAYMRSGAARGLKLVKGG